MTAAKLCGKEFYGYGDLIAKFPCLFPLSSEPEQAGYPRFISSSILPALSKSLVGVLMSVRTLVSNITALLLRYYQYPLDTCFL
jgi:hypothetical protein